jgi:hypothetical protein
VSAVRYLIDDVDPLPIPNIHLDEGQTHLTPQPDIVKAVSSLHFQQLFVGRF